MRGKSKILIELFGKRSEREILEIKYKSLLEESFKLSASYQMKRELLRAEVGEVLQAIERLKEE